MGKINILRIWIVTKVLVQYGVHESDSGGSDSLAYRYIDKLSSMHLSSMAFVSKLEY